MGMLDTVARCSTPAGPSPDGQSTEQANVTRQNLVGWSATARDAMKLKLEFFGNLFSKVTTDLWLRSQYHIRQKNSSKFAR
ncbi:hypothetical protein QLX08_009837 [Tetragonisca angustula]|uniref:Uncharacterized protein n=1 Tax=Tetragonisca angustula TaxID=166442 RepID=A0AAW0ZFD6_9HYME